MFRAYETTTGRLLWKARLPAGGNASPTTYWSNASGRQFVVIAAGGHGAMLSGASDALIAYALPKPSLSLSLSLSLSNSGERETGASTLAK